MNDDNADENQDNKDNDNNETSNEKIVQEFYTFVDLYKTKSIDYDKVQTSNKQLLDQKNKTEQPKIHYKIIDDIFEEKPEFHNNKINILFSKTVKKIENILLFLFHSLRKCN